MLHWEFTKLMGRETTEEEYNEANAVYNKTEMFKDQFCKEWKKMSDDMKNGIRLAAKEQEDYWQAKYNALLETTASLATEVKDLREEAEEEAKPMTMAELRKAYEQRKETERNEFNAFVEDSVRQILSSSQFLDEMVKCGEYHIVIRMQDENDTETLRIINKALIIVPNKYRDYELELSCTLCMDIEALLGELYDADLDNGEVSVIQRDCGYNKVTIRF